MRKSISILMVSAVIIGLTLSLSGILVSQAAPVEKQQGPNREVPKPIPATNIEVVKKVFSEDVGKGKGKPSPSPETGGAATGILGGPATGNKYAVVIGICDYPGTANDICLSDGDSYNMRKALIQNYGFVSTSIIWLRDMGGATTDGVAYGVPTYQNIYDAVMEIKDKVTSTDEVVFFFSGHGAKGTAKDDDAEETDEAIVVHDNDGAMDADGYSTLDFIWDGELRSWFDGFGATRIVFVFDSCLAGGMNDVADTGRVVSMATGETQSAYVYSIGELGEGVFSHYFVKEGMLQGLADGYNQLKTTDGNVVVEEAFEYAKTTIPLKHPYLKQRQKPVISDKFGNDLLLGY